MNLLFLPHCLNESYQEKIMNLVKDKNYEVHVLPGGSKMKKILDAYDLNKIDKLIGIACDAEIPLARDYLQSINFPSNKIFIEELIITGCENTECDLNELEKKL